MIEVKFNPANYDEHMIRWRDWKTANIPISSGTSSPGARMIAHGDHRIMSDGARARKMLTANGKQTDRDRSSIPLVNGTDTEKAIDKAMSWLRESDPEIHRVIESQFMHQGSSKSKALQIGIGYDAYRRKMTDGKRAIAAFIAGMTARTSTTTRNQHD